MKKIIAMILTALLLTGIVQQPQALELQNNEEQIKINEMLQDGLTRQEAEKVMKFERIKLKLQKTGQVIDYDEKNQKVKLLNKSADNRYALDSNELNLLQDELKQRSKYKDKITPETRQEALEKYVREHPNSAKVKLDFEDGSWIESTTTSELTTPIDSDKVNVYYNYLPNQKVVSTKYFPSIQTYLQNHEVKQYIGVNYNKFFLKQYATVKPSWSGIKTYGQIAGSANYGIGVTSQPIFGGDPIRDIGKDVSAVTREVISVETTVSCTVSAGASFGIDAFVTSGTVDYSVSATSGLKYTTYAMICNNLYAQMYSIGLYY